MHIQQQPAARSVGKRLALPHIPEVSAPGFRNQFGIDVLLVNPPSPNRDPYIRDIHRVGRNSREGTIWPQTALAQLAAMFGEDTSVRVVDCIAERMTWPQFEQLLVEVTPRYYITQATAPTLTNDMRGVFLAKALGATTMAMGTHVSPAADDTLRAFPALDFALRGEPEETVRELVDTLESVRLKAVDQQDQLSDAKRTEALSQVKGIAYLHDGCVVMTPDRPFVADLDNLPIPRHELLPLKRLQAPRRRGTLYLRGHQPRMSGRLSLLYQARDLSEYVPVPLSGAHYEGSRQAGRAGYDQHPL